MITEKQIKDFVRESNHIEGIMRDGTSAEIEEFIRFIGLDVITIDDLKQFVSIYQPNARLRDQSGLNVRVGNYLPPLGGPKMTEAVNILLDSQHNSYKLHCYYEKLHPFTDCNGRSGRALWAWKERNLRLGFLHMFYYQTLENFK